MLKIHQIKKILVEKRIETKIIKETKNKINAEPPKLLPNLHKFDVPKNTKPAERLVLLKTPETLSK